MTYHSAAKGALAAGKKVLIFPSVLISPSEVGIVTSYLAAFTLITWRQGAFCSCIRLGSQSCSFATTACTMHVNSLHMSTREGYAGFQDAKHPAQVPKPLSY